MGGTAVVTYRQARADHEYLWSTYGPASDMPDGYVDSGDLEKLMEPPTKATAARVYEDQTRYWFQVGPEPHGLVARMDGPWNRRLVADPKVAEIADRYDIPWEVGREPNWTCSITPPQRHRRGAGAPNPSPGAASAVRGRPYPIYVPLRGQRPASDLTADTGSQIGARTRRLCDG